jgi:hypothetical protein
MKKIISLITIMLASCGTTTQDVEYKLDFSPELQDQVFEYLADCQRHIHTHRCNQRIELKVKVQKLPEPNQLGVCQTFYPPNDYKRYIYISPKVMGTSLQKMVLYHEMTHCLFDEDHYDTEVDIMNSYTEPKKAEWIYKHWEFFLTKMFERISP